MKMLRTISKNKNAYYYSDLTDSQGIDFGAGTDTSTSIPLDFNRFSRNQPELDISSNALEEKKPVQFINWIELSKLFKSYLLEFEEQQLTKYDFTLIINKLLNRNVDFSSERLKFPEPYIPSVYWSYNTNLLSVQFNECLKVHWDFKVEESINILGENIPQLTPQVLKQIEEWEIKEQFFEVLNSLPKYFKCMYEYDSKVSIDPEIPERKGLRIILTVTGTPEEVFKDELAFKKQIFSTLDIKARELITIAYNWKE